MRERLKDRMRLEHILEAIDRLQTHAGGLSREEKANLFTFFEMLLRPRPRRKEKEAADLRFLFSPLGNRSDQSP